MLHCVIRSVAGGVIQSAVGNCTITLYCVKIQSFAGNCMYTALHCVLMLSVAGICTVIILHRTLY